MRAGQAGPALRVKAGLVAPVTVRVYFTRPRAGTDRTNGRSWPNQKPLHRRSRTYRPFAPNQSHFKEDRSFIGWLDSRSLFSDVLVIKFTLAIYALAAAHGTSFYVTAEDVKLAFSDAAIVTRLAICSPILFLVAIANAVEILAADAKARFNRVV